MNLSGQLIAGTGNFEIKEVTDSSAYPLLDKGTKYLECTSAGTVVTPSDVAYGEWEWDWYKLSDGNQIGVDFISSGSDKYTLYFTASERIALYRASALSQTDADYISIKTWYRVKLTRTLDGEFTFYVRGGEFGNDDWTLVSPVTTTNPFTDNTYTESQYFVLDLDIGDRFANLTVKNLVKQ